MNISLVIPCRNSAHTINACLDSVVPLKDQGMLEEIIVVNDASVDATVDIVRSYDAVNLVEGGGLGPGSARNVGWRHAKGDYIWFVDSDCVVNDNTLPILMNHFSDERIAGVGGSYANVYPQYILPWMIQEEIVVRHSRMKTDAHFLAGYNVLYRRVVLEEVGGFDETQLNGPGAPGAEDIDLSLRIKKRGYTLQFDRTSVVQHHHPRLLTRYLRSQYVHGYWRAGFHVRHRDTVAGDAYSSFVDHSQPVLAMVVIVASCLSPWTLVMRPVYFVGFFLLFLLQLPMALAVYTQTNDIRAFVFIGLGWVRSFARGLGLSAGVVSLWVQRKGVHD